MATKMKLDWLFMVGMRGRNNIKYPGKKNIKVCKYKNHVKKSKLMSKFRPEFKLFAIWFGFFAKWHIKLRVLFNAKTIDVKDE